ncbi:hypothetical protein QVD17_11306 [Tagetes erecta]|uniref:Cathepsin propeptide inhibitor domain-containing protein n=1 Tax=Tagetes erecta TaxID=13708 RepID=A0AAD8KT75_TARER|nr:hypothetical protein QVD17_11306 [Tagetes erecta]
MALYLFLKKSFPCLISANTKFPACCYLSKGRLLDDEYDYDVENEDEMRAKYESFLVKYDKFYPNPKVKERRFNNFKETLRFLKHHKATNTNPINNLGINCMADVAISEINGLLRVKTKDPSPFYRPPPPPRSHPKTPRFHPVDYAKAKSELVS